MTYLADTERYRAEYEGGFLFIEDKAAGREHMVKLKNARGQCITRGEFSSSCKSHGPDRACEVFIKLAVKVPQ